MMSQLSARISLKTLLEEPPRRISVKVLQDHPEKYFREEQPVEIRVFFRLFSVFGDTSTLAYAA